MAGDGDVGFEERMSWLLPTRVLDDPCDSKEYLTNQRHQQRDHRLKSPPERLHSKSSLKPHHRPKHPSNWAPGGPGMQAIFLDSGPRSSGTGVFLPQRAGAHVKSTKKPACSPVLLPSRVVQALNLNVHELGLQIKPQRDLNNNSKVVERSKKMGKDASTQCCVISQSRSSSPEIFLPKEWTY
ncbi:hypothetical protein F0562_021277 [Nyssa sinensis]|uniref:Uncharacterized protein n=1 Tax=Nyssa sinensis TaxID=561372 RepID=A0A5J5BKR2_9ASTE|nr:hypothetical protein F0562_021277 [Nyssa sinensis]